MKARAVHLLAVECNAHPLQCFLMAVVHKQSIPGPFRRDAQFLTSNQTRDQLGQIPGRQIP